MDSYLKMGVAAILVVLLFIIIKGAIKTMLKIVLGLILIAAAAFLYYKFFRS